MPAKSSAPFRNRLLHFIANYIKAEGGSPTIREMGAAFNITSTSVVTYHLEILEAAGHIERKPGQSRTIRIIGELPPLDDAEATIVPRKPRNGKPRRYDGYYERGAPIADVVVSLPYSVAIPRPQRRK
jgi:SOS-response transcriptional repressor LexA